MAFGQASGPTAPARQVAHLADLLQRAGFASFREARHPYGLTQRQAGGNFTADEASELIERLEAAEIVEQASSPSPGPTDPPPRSGRQPKRTTLKQLEDSVLVAELERRGWCCIAPPHDNE